MGNNLYIHIGLPKTATTTLQRIVLSHLPSLNFLGKPYKYSQLEKFFDQLKFKGLLHYNTDSVEKNYKQEIKPLFDEKRPNMISDEVLTFNFNVNPRAVPHTIIAERLKNLFGNKTNILITLRRQIDFLKSWFVQYKNSLPKNHSLESLDNWLRYQIAKNKYGKIKEFDLLRYCDLVAFYESLFGSDRVHLLLYEQFKHNPKQFFESLGKILGQEIKVDDYDFDQTQLKSRFTERQKAYMSVRSLIPTSIQFGNHLPSWIRNSVKNFLKQSPKIEPTISLKMEETLEDVIRSQNRKLSKRRNELPLEKYNYKV